MDATRVLDAVAPWKDVDAFHPENVGLLAQGRPRFLPCTPHGIQQMLHRHQIAVSGKHVVVVGRSDIVGKPLALMLMQRTSPMGSSAANATVTVCHSRTRDLVEIARQADVLVAAIGVARFVTAAMVRPGATVIDVGINRTEDGLVGDVDYRCGASGCRAHHSGSRRCRTDDHRHAVGQHAPGCPTAALHAELSRRPAWHSR